jgi:lysophospholipase L1-like esterase
MDGLGFYAEGDYFHGRQVAVTYEHAGSTWDGPRPEFQDFRLPRSLMRLRQDKRLTLILFGDSISVGANASSLFGASPNLPTWGELVNLKLEDYFRAEITYANPSEGGRDSTWGLAEIRSRVAEKPVDLVILAFGMNDGSAGLEASSFRANLAAMMGVVSTHNPGAEFLLVAPMLANPESFFDGRQPEYGDVVRSLARVGVAAVDMGQMHAALLKRKRYADLTGNNINHPNDFLSRCYAMATLSALIEFDKERTV